MDTSQDTDVTSVSAADPTDSVRCDLLDSRLASTDAVVECPAKACLSPLSGASAPQTKSPVIADPDPPCSPVLATAALSNATGERNPPLPQEYLLQSPPPYSSPEAIYARYVAARSAWFESQPAGSIKTNQQYRRAMGLPQRYDKTSYVWCLDYKQMSKRCITGTGSREWTKEEMMSYLDWNKAEDERVEALVAKEMGDNPLAHKRRAMREIWGYKNSAHLRIK